MVNAIAFTFARNICVCVCVCVCVWQFGSNDRLGEGRAPSDEVRRLRPSFL